MGAIDHLVDGLQLFLTGGTSNTDPASSLGGAPSTSRGRGLGAIVASPIPSLRFDNVYPNCGVGAGTVKVDISGNLVFTPPGASAGAAVVPISNGSVIITGSDTSKAIRVFQEAGLPTPKNSISTLTLVEIVNGVLSQSNVANAARVAGEVTYRALMLKVPGPNAVNSIKVWFPAVAGLQSTFSVGQETPVAGSIQTIANETTAPTGIAWTTPTTEGTSLHLGTIISGGSKGLWIRRTFPAAGHVNPLEKVQMALKYSAL